ncbi:hypothetical protein ACHWQZ_G014400 [Mnemiopsis leidyi]
MENDDDDSSSSSSGPEPDDLAKDQENCISLRGAVSSRRWMSRKSVRILTICTLMIMVATIVPNIHWGFITLFFEKEGASTLAIAIYASCMSVFVLVSSIFSQSIMRLMSLKKMIFLSVVFLSVSTCLHGMLILLDDVEWMIVGGVIIRAIQGVSGTVMQVLAVSILIMRFPEKCGRVSAVNESALGLGFAISPFLGGIVYDKVGFLLTFVALGSTGLLMLVALFTTPSSLLTNNTGRQKKYSRMDCKDLLFLSPMMICCLSSVVEACVDYMMALYVNDVFGEDATFTGLLLSGLSLSSILFAFALGYFCDKFNPFLTGLIGCFLTCLGLLAMVPPPFLQSLIPVNKPQLMTATIVTGLGQAMIWLHVLPAMLFVKTKCRDKPVNEELSNLVSLLYIVATSTGEFAGSFLAAHYSGGLHEWCSYWQLFAIISGAMMFCTLFCALCYLCSARSLSNSTDSISTAMTSGCDSKDTVEMVSLTGEVVSI